MSDLRRHLAIGFAAFKSTRASFDRTPLYTHYSTVPPIMLREVDPIHQTVPSTHGHQVPQWRRLDELCPDIPEWRSLAQLTGLESVSPKIARSGEQVLRRSAAIHRVDFTRTSGDGGAHPPQVVESTSADEQRWAD